jgi:hypothetical protein
VYLAHIRMEGPDRGFLMRISMERMELCICMGAPGPITSSMYLAHIRMDWTKASSCVSDDLHGLTAEHVERCISMGAPGPGSRPG